MAAGTATMKDVNRREWGRTAQQYAANFHQGPGLMMPLISAYLEALSGSKGQLHILDLASGSGEPGLSLAKALPDSTVLLTDLAPEMVTEASARAQAQGLTNVRFEAADAEDLGKIPDASMDAATCNCGLMFMPHPDRALSEIRRVLKPAGHLLFSVWGPEEITNFIALIKTMQRRVAPSDSFFADPSHLGDEAKLLALLRQAGFSSCQCREVNVPMAIPKERLRTGLLDNAVVSELLNRLQAKGQADIYDRAEKAFMEAAAEAGYLQGDVMSAPRNVALFVTARA